MKLVYKKRLFCFIILNFLTGPILLAQSYGDTALFKIEEQIFYLSSVNHSFKALNIFRCLESKSVLMESLKLSNSEYEVLNPLVSDYVVLQRRQDQLQKLVLLNKIFLYSSSVNVSVKEDDLQALGFYKCHKKNLALSNTLKLLIKSEFLLRDRFLKKRNATKYNENLFEKLRIFYSGIDRKLKDQVYFR